MDFLNYVEGFSDDNPPQFFREIRSNAAAAAAADSFTMMNASSFTTTTTTLLSSHLGNDLFTFPNLTGNDATAASSANGSQTAPPSSSTNYTKESLTQYFIYDVAHFINQYYLWVVFAFGFPGNIVSFITVIHMKPFTSPTMYVAALALVDNTCLTCKLLFLMLTRYDAPLGDGGCSVLLFLGSFTAQFANWLLVAMTVERCLAICVPLKVGSICTRKIHIAGIVLIAVTLAGLNAQHFVTNTMHNRNGDYSCNSNPEYAEFMKVWYWVDALFTAILPAILLVVMNTLLILGIRRSAKIQRELTSKATQAVETMRQQRQITIMLVIVCISFVVLITPNALFYAIKHHWVVKLYSYEHAKYLFTEQLIFLLSDSTHAVNFYLYFFSTRRFRKRCLETVMFCCVGGRRSRSLRSSGISGGSNAFRMSMTEMTSVPANNASVPLRHFSSSSSSSTSSLGRGRHVVVKNGGKDNNHSGTAMESLMGSNGGGKKNKKHKTKKSKLRTGGRSDNCPRYAVVS